MCYSMAEIEEQELREAKRACNFIWAAAENYELEPLFLAFASNGTADMYLNLIIGLSYKWYDQEKIDDFFNQLGGKDRVRRFASYAAVVFLFFYTDTVNVTYCCLVFLSVPV